jgi:acetylornithine deacetylase/succinyl-diaminopimelate desuccinylase-like protein
LYNAHIDTVFNQLDTITPAITGNILAAPSCGDNSSSVAGLLFFIRMMRELSIVLPTGILFAFNVGEEGLGNLKGMRHIMTKWQNRISEVIAVDCTFDTFVNVAVGSRRYAVSVEAEGGHSWMHFGNDNAIAIAASIISQLYALTVPAQPKTTYNIGTISGGTTVNSIAAHAEFTVDLRSESMAELEQLDTAFKAILAQAQTPKIKITHTILGERPCSNGVLNAEIYDRITNIRRRKNLETVFVSASTDANIPLSQGIPAISFGFCRSHGEHTVHETLELDTLMPGILQMAEFMFFHD